MTIRNPILWGWDVLRPVSAQALSRAGERLTLDQAAPDSAPRVRRIDLHDVRESLRLGFHDFTASRTDVIMLCLIYPIIGLVLGRVGLGHQVLPLLFPLAAGFALLGPLAAVGLNEMSRQRERGAPVTWRAVFDVLQAPSLGGIVGLGLLLTALFLAWLLSALLIWRATIGATEPASIAAFLHTVFATPPGWALILLGVSVGFLFAALVFCMTVVSFPLLLDRRVGLGVAIRTSLGVIRKNPQPMAAWGAVITLGLILGSLPCLIGLAIVLPVCGHATWHLYRRVIG